MPKYVVAPLCVMRSSLVFFISAISAFMVFISSASFSSHSSRVLAYKFLLRRGFRGGGFTCLGGLRFGHLCVCTADFSVNSHGCLLLHGVGDMAVYIERGLRADVAYHSGESFDINVVFQCHRIIYCNHICDFINAKLKYTDVFISDNVYDVIKYIVNLI